MQRSRIEMRAAWRDLRCLDIRHEDSSVLVNVENALIMESMPVALLRSARRIEVAPWIT